MSDVNTAYQAGDPTVPNFFSHEPDEHAGGEHRREPGRDRDQPASRLQPGQPDADRRRAPRSPIFSGGQPDQSYASFIAQVGSDVQSAQNTPADRGVAAERDRQPAPERLGRLARRRDDQPDQLPARLSGIGAGDDHDRQHARHADQPHGNGRVSDGADHHADDLAVDRLRHQLGAQPPHQDTDSSCPRASGSPSRQTTRTARASRSS